MITMVEVRNSRGGLLSLPMGDLADGVAVTNIEGLGPVKATLVSSSFANMDGAQYHSSRRETRNIVMTMELPVNYGTESVSDRRKKLYNFFMPKSKTNLRFYQLGDVDVYAEGRIETCEPSMFTEEPGVVVSILCFDPDFIDPDVVTVNGSTTSGLTESVIEYGGSVETGILFTLNVDRDFDMLSLYHRAEDDITRSLEFSAPLIAGDVLRVSTVPGDKYVTLTRSGVQSSLLYGMSPFSYWIELVPGDNYLRAYAEGAAVPYTIQYITRYGGL